MDVTQLLLLRELADRGSITAVAVAVGRTPSAVSQQLRALQRRAGVTLIRRHGRGVRLTTAGEALAEAGRGVATALARAESAWQNWQSEPAGMVSLSVFPSVGELLLPGLLRRLSTRAGLEVSLHDNDVAQPDFPALTGHHDLVLAHRGEVLDTQQRTGLLACQLFREPVDVAVPVGHSLAGRGGVEAAEIVGEDWIGVPTGYPLARLLESLALRAGRPALVRWHSTDFGTQAAMVRAGLGICLLPRHSTGSSHDGIVLLPVSDVLLARQVEVLARPDNAARGAVNAVLEELIDLTAPYRSGDLD